MGEYDVIIEKLNKVLVESGFAKVYKGILSPGDDAWYSSVAILLRFDNRGNYVKPENGLYD